MLELTTNERLSQRLNPEGRMAFVRIKNLDKYPGGKTFANPSVADFFFAACDHKPSIIAEAMIRGYKRRVSDPNAIIDESCYLAVDDLTLKTIMCPAQCAIEEVLNYRFEASVLLSRRYGVNSDRQRRGFLRDEEVRYISNVFRMNLTARPEELVRLKMSLDEFRLGIVAELLQRCKIGYVYGNHLGEISEKLIRAESWRGMDASFSDKIPLIQEWILLARSLGV